MAPNPRQIVTALSVPVNVHVKFDATGSGFHGAHIVQAKGYSPEVDLSEMKARQRARQHRLEHRLDNVLGHLAAGNADVRP